MTMTITFRDELARIMQENDKVCIIDADLAMSNDTWLLKKRFPERALNVGVAEANMVGVAAGLSSYGYVPFVSTFAQFASKRAADQIYLSICYARQNVKILGTSCGVCAGVAGGTHMAFEDVAIMRSYPTMVVFEPADSEELKKSLHSIVTHYGPVYIRMSRDDLPVLHTPEYCFDLFSADVLCSGDDYTILASGILVSEAMEAAKSLANDGIRVEVINVHTIKPLDENTILKSIQKTGKVLTCENSNVIGGLYSAISEMLCQRYPTKVERIGIFDEFGQVAHVDQLIDHYKLNAKAIVKKVKSTL